MEVSKNKETMSEHIDFNVAEMPEDEWLIIRGLHAVEHFWEKVEEFENNRFMSAFLLALAVYMVWYEIEEMRHAERMSEENVVVLGCAWVRVSHAFKELIGVVIKCLLRMKHVLPKLRRLF